MQKYREKSGIIANPHFSPADGVGSRGRPCEKACPIDLPILDYKDSGIMSHCDCLKCPECIAVCPANALRWSSKKS